MDPNIDFSPEEMAGFAKTAALPYMQYARFMKRAGSNYTSRTTMYQRLALSQDRNWMLSTQLLEFRDGTIGVKSVYWWCYENEGEIDDQGNAYNLDESFDIGTAIFPSPGMYDNDVYELWNYISQSESIFHGKEITGEKRMSEFYKLWQTHVANHANQRVAEYERARRHESKAGRLVRFMLNEEEDPDEPLMRELATKAAGIGHEVVLAMQKGEELRKVIPAPQDYAFELELHVSKLDPPPGSDYFIADEKRARMLSVKWKHMRSHMPYAQKEGGGWSWYLPEAFPALPSLIQQLKNYAGMYSLDDDQMSRAYSRLLDVSKPVKPSKTFGNQAWHYSSGQANELRKFGKRRKLGRRGQSLLPR